MGKVVEVFIHGLESSAQGTKGKFFRTRRPNMIIDDYTGSFSERMEKLEKRLSKAPKLVIVGSSYGGLMAAVYACRHPDQVKKLILLAPALHLQEFVPFRNHRLSIPTVIYHGNKDEIVPLEEVKKIATYVFLDLTHYVVEDDHALNTVFPSLPWDNLLKC
ncbi:MAG: alpha/beta fold hydrolase [Syntrophales bacterium]|nr:alpha/beta fold hydrolase [Syntrophales bacterium]